MTEKWLLVTKKVTLLGKKLLSQRGHKVHKFYKKNVILSPAFLSPIKINGKEILCGLCKDDIQQDTTRKI